MGAPWKSRLNCNLLARVRPFTNLSSDFVVSRDICDYCRAASFLGISDLNFGLLF